MNRSLHGAELEMTLQSVKASRQDGEFVLASRGETISGLQIDLRFDPNLVTVQIEPAMSIVDQQKEVSQIHLEPGLIRVLMIGFNASPLLDGAVLKVHLTLLKETRESSRLIQPSNLVATSSEGEPVHVVLIDPIRKSPQTHR